MHVYDSIYFDIEYAIAIYLKIAFLFLVFFLYFCPRMFCKKFLCILFLTFANLFFVCLISENGALWAQTGTVSPFSRFGYGELTDNAPIAFRGMGGVTVGMRKNTVINSMQPASFTACDSATFMFDFATSLSWNQYADAGGTKNKANGVLDYVTLQIPIWRKYIAFSLGLLPYSQSGYSYSQYDSTSTNIHYHNQFYGEGGIKDLYAGLSINIKHWVAVGANIYYMFGNVNKYRSVTFVESGLNPIAQVTDIDVNSLRYRLGLQVFHTFVNKHEFVLGGIFENKKTLQMSYSIREASLDESVDFVPRSDKAFEIPMVFGGGLSYTFDKRLTVAGDFIQKQWSQTKFLNQKGSFADYNKLALGVEYRHNAMGRNYAERMYWRLGANVSNQYDKSVSAKNYNISLGMGFPFRTSATILNFVVDYGHRGSKSTLEENYLRFSINASINENWFFKRRL